MKIFYLGLNLAENEVFSNKMNEKRTKSQPQRSKIKKVENMIT